MPKAEAHTKTHTSEYFLNVEALLTDTIAEGLGRTGVIELLEILATNYKAVISHYMKNYQI